MQLLVKIMLYIPPWSIYLNILEILVLMLSKLVTLIIKYELRQPSAS